jgi:hypothetical protein
VLDVHGDDPVQRLARQVRAFSRPAQPAVGHREQLGAEMLDDSQHELVAVAEVDVERGSRQVRAPHHLVDCHLAERPLTQERLGSGDDLALGNLGGPPAPPCGDLPTLILRVHGLRVARRITMS